MRLVENEGAAWDVDEAGVFGIAFEAEETTEEPQVLVRSLTATLAGLGGLFTPRIPTLPTTTILTGGLTTRRTFSVIALGVVASPTATMNGVEI